MNKLQLRRLLYSDALSVFSTLPCTYLGLPLSMNKITLVDLMPVIQKVDKRLSGSTATYFSWRTFNYGQFCPLAIPTHIMTCFIWPSKGD